jgi:hypothetical protein
MPVREKGTNGTGTRASRPVSRPCARAERRETAGLSTHRHGIHCTDKLRAGGRWIRTSDSRSRGGQTVMRDCLENRSGSVGEPKVRIHLPPAASHANPAIAMDLARWEATPLGISRPRSTKVLRVGGRLLVLWYRLFTIPIRAVLAFEARWTAAPNEEDSCRCRRCNPRLRLRAHPDGHSRRHFCRAFAASTNP